MELLTKELQRLLLSRGYKYILIKDIRKASPDRFDYILQPAVHIPAVQSYSCTSLEDHMVNSILQKEIKHIDLYIELTPEDIAWNRPV